MSAAQWGFCRIPFREWVLIGCVITGCVEDRAGSASHLPLAAQESSVTSGSVQLQRLWSGGEFNFYASSPSPDGRYVTEIDWLTGDLAVRDLATAELHRLTEKGTWQESGDYALSSTFSPDGRGVAYVWWNSDGHRHELRTLDFDVDSEGRPSGSNPRTLHDALGLQAYAVHGWSPEDEILAVLRRPDRTTALALVSVLDGATTVLESFDWRAPHPLFSPNGQLIAYDVPVAVTAAQRDMRLISRSGDRRVDLGTGSIDATVLGWASQEALIYATRDRGLSTLWRLPLRGGRPPGAAEVLSGAVAGRVEPLGSTVDAFYFGVTVETRTYGLAEMDLDGGRLLEDPEPLDNPYGGRMDALDWSADGHHYAAAVRTDLQGTGFLIVIGSPDGSLLNTFQGTGRVEKLRWVPGEEQVVFYGFDEGDRPTLRLLDLSSGDMKTIRRFDRPWGAMGGHLALSADGRELYFRLLAPGAQVSRPTEGAIVALDLETGAERRIQSVRWGGSLAISPDGKRLAYADYDPENPGGVLLRETPTDAGAPIDVVSRIEGVVEGLNWTPDGASIVFLGGSPGTGEHDLQLVSATGQAVVTHIDTPALGFADPRLHPDGKRIAVVSGENRGEIWALSRIGERAEAPDPPLLRR